MSQWFVEKLPQLYPSRHIVLILSGNFYNGTMHFMLKLWAFRHKAQAPEFNGTKFATSISVKGFREKIT
jgi:hypothetical protein